jgi:hypothetical protein
MRKIITRTTAGVAALAALALGGAAIAGASSSGSTSTGSTATTPPQGYGSGTGPGPGFPAGEAPGTAAHEAAEKAVTGEAADKAKAAALASVPGTATEVTTDFRGNGYEVAVTKSDGTHVTVHLDSSFKVMAMPPRGAGGGPPAGTTPPGGAAPGAAPSYGQAPPAA